jgi:hypothetical protein
LIRQQPAGSFEQLFLNSTPCESYTNGSNGDFNGENGALSHLISGISAIFCQFAMETHIF